MNLNSPFLKYVGCRSWRVNIKNKKDFDLWLLVFAKEAKVIHLKQSLKDKEVIGHS